jgi:outer membrane protein assembly factor BamB
MKRSFIIVVVSALALAGNNFVASSSKTDPAHWPQWRGPFFNGMARTGAPVEFGDNKNIKWKAAIPGRGFSTPVIWEDRIYLTTAVPTGKTNEPQPGRRPVSNPAGGTAAGEEHKFIIMCLDRKTGKVIWERVAKVAAPHEGYHRNYGSFASSSPVTDGKFLYVSFGSRGIYCYDLNGKPIWEKDLGVQLRMRNEFGEGSAPALYNNLLIHNFDQESGSFAIALDKGNGKELWRVNREEVSAWSTPLVIDAKGKKQILIAASNKVRAYQPEDGRVVWECAGLGANVIPQPVQYNDTVLVMSGFRDPKLMAIRLGREGDLTGTDSILWSQTRGMSYTPSPVLNDNKFYALTDNGMLSCFNATTGEAYYQQKRLPQADNFKASPVGAGDKLYLASESGVVTVVKMGEQFELVATNTFEDQTFISSPVVAEGELFLRSKTHLFCVGEGKQP